MRFATAKQPAVHSTHMQNLVSAFETLSGEDRRRVLESDPELFEWIAAAPRAKWMHIDASIRIIDAIHNNVPEPLAHQYYSDCISRQFETPLWSNFVEGAIRLFGLDPGGSVRWIPHAYGIIFKNCGLWSAKQTGDFTAIVSAAGLPSVVSGNLPWLRSHASGLRAIFVLYDTEADIQLKAVDQALGTAEYWFEWKS